MEAIPKKGPVILAATHPNSFTDDVTLGAFLKRPVIFLARGDVFKSNIGNFFLKAMHTYPIFRGRDNSGDVQKNLDNFTFYQNYLSKNGVILIHPEGLSLHEKNVRPIKKGIGRIAFGAEDIANWNLGVTIVPIGINYTNGPYAQGDIMVQAGEPFPASKYKELYLENPNKANSALAQDLTTLLQAKSIIQYKGTEAVCEKSLTIARNQISENPDIVSDNSARFAIEKKVSDSVNQLFRSDKVVYGDLEMKLESYFKQLANANITDLQVKQNKRHGFSIINFLHLFISFVGYYTHVLPYKLAVNLTERAIQSIVFRSAILIGLNYVFFILIYFTLTILALVFFGLIGFSLIVILSIIGFMGKDWIRLKRLYTQQKNYQKLKKQQSKIIAQLQGMRTEICGILNLL